MPVVGSASFWMYARPAVEPLRARRIPLLIAALGFMAGILCARHDHPPAMLAASAVLLFLLAWVAVRAAPRVGWLALLAVWVVAGCWCAQVERPVARQTALLRYADGLSRTVRGRVAGISSLRGASINRATPQVSNQSWALEPGAWEPDEIPPVQTIDLAVDAVEEVTPDLSTMQATPGGVRLTLTGRVLPLRCGDLIEVPVRLHEPEVYRDPGAFSFADWMLTQGIGALASAKASKLHLLASSPGSLHCRLQTMQHWAAARLAGLPSSRALQWCPSPLRLNQDDASMLAAMLFGDRTTLNQDLRSGFERTGTFHLFVVSGLHVALFTGALFWLLRKLRLAELPAVLLTIAMAFGYALLTGFGVPVQRALAMSSLYLLARAFDRQSSGLNALGVAALLILIADPRALFLPSFQMTALVILAVAGLAAPLSERLLQNWKASCTRLDRKELDAFLHPCVASRRVQLRQWSALCRDLLHGRLTPLPVWIARAWIVFAEACLVSGAIELCMSLPMAFYFHRATPMALPSNLLIAPATTLLAASGVLTFVLCLLSPWLALPLAAFTALLLHAIQHIIHLLAHVSLGDLRVPSPPPVATLLFCLLLTFACWALRTQRRLFAVSGAVAACLLVVTVLWPVSVTAHRGILEVTALDVGQGDSLLVISPEGRTLLVDAGGPVGRLTTRWDVGEEVVAPYLWSRRIRQLDAVLVTHAHSDHIGGMPAILRDFRPRELWLSIEPGESPALRDLLTLARAEHIEIHRFTAGDHFRWGGVEATVLAPQPGYQNPGAARNDDSLVMRLGWQKASVLLEGHAKTQASWPC